MLLSPREVNRRDLNLSWPGHSPAEQPAPLFDGSTFLLFILETDGVLSYLECVGQCASCHLTLGGTKGVYVWAQTGRIWPRLVNGFGGAR